MPGAYEIDERLAQMLVKFVNYVLDFIVFKERVQNVNVLQGKSG